MQMRFKQRFSFVCEPVAGPILVNDSVFFLVFLQWFARSILEFRMPAMQMRSKQWFSFVCKPVASFDFSPPILFWLGFAMFYAL